MLAALEVELCTLLERLEAPGWQEWPSDEHDTSQAVQGHRQLTNRPAFLPFRRLDESRLGPLLDHLTFWLRKRVERVLAERPRR